MKFKAVCNRLPIETRIVVIGLPGCETICELEQGTPIPKEVWKADVLQLVPIEDVYKRQVWTCVDACMFDDWRFKNKSGQGCSFFSD